MKTIVYISIALLISLSSFAQDPILQKNNQELEKIATDLTRAYDEQLALTGKQFILFRKKVEEFLIREEEIHERYFGEEKLDYINEIRQAETFEMRNILTDMQYDKYKSIKPIIQPIAVLDKEED